VRIVIHGRLLTAPAGRILRAFTEMMDGNAGGGSVRASMGDISARSQNTGKIPLRTLDVRQIRRD
jgi:hypothetical protein